MPKFNRPDPFEITWDQGRLKGASVGGCLAIYAQQTHTALVFANRSSHRALTVIRTDRRVLGPERRGTSAGVVYIRPA